MYICMYIWLKWITEMVQEDYELAYYMWHDDLGCIDKLAQYITRMINKIIRNIYCAINLNSSILSILNIKRGKTHRNMDCPLIHIRNTFRTTYVQIYANI